MNSELHTVEEQLNKDLPPYSFPLIVTVAFFLMVLTASSVYAFMTLTLPTRDFPLEETVSIPEGSSLNDIAVILKEHGAIESPTYFKLRTLMHGASEKLQAGEYRFPYALSPAELIETLAEGRYGNEFIVLTIPEGTRVKDMDEIISTALPHISPGAFAAAAEPYEGFLFPETYHVAPDATPKELISLMQKTYNERVWPRLQEASSTRSEHDIITLASILEREGNEKENMGIISGILLKRLELGMPLQVDATLEYERGLGSSELTVLDLEKDSRYNTYTRKGLPPTPIANPGLMAIEAVLTPKKSPYLYYLTGNDGTFYYGRTFEEHKRNKERYLK